MATSTAKKLDDWRGSEQVLRAIHGGGEPPAPPVRPNVPVVSNARLALLMFIGAETMFFAGLIGAFLVFRLSAPVWPPPFQPRLPLLMTGFNTAVLLASALTMHLSVRSVLRGNHGHTLRHLWMTSGLGTAFLMLQGIEWARLIHFGLTVSSSVYGGLFYTLIGAHGLHVLGALLWLAIVLVRAAKGRYTKANAAGLELCSTYWIFVVALWPVLYGFVYLL